MVFLPFHYGYWDTPPNPASGAHHRAANELTLTDWDPVSKQPIFKTAAAAAVKVSDSGGTPAPAPTTTGSRPVADGQVPPTHGNGHAGVDEELVTTGGAR